MPDSGKPKPTGTATGGTEEIVNSKLLIFTKNGTGTTSTAIGGEFGAKLIWSAKVDGEFSMQWSRPKAGNTEKGKIYLKPLGVPGAAEGFIPDLEVSMPAQSTAVNIGITMPDTKPGIYQLTVIGQTGNSSVANIMYSGKGGGPVPVVIAQPATPAPMPAPTSSAVFIVGATFKPEVSAPGENLYKRGHLELSFKTPVDVSISKIEVEVWSQPWSNSELLTSTSAKNSPILLYKGRMQFGPNSKLYKDKVNMHSIPLRRSTANDIDPQESSPGFYSPADWGHAFAQTTMATFRWKVISSSGNLSGQFDNSAKQGWLWP